MEKNNPQHSAAVRRHLLKDYTFLHDYIIVDMELNHSRQALDQKSQAPDVGDCEVFVAQIMGTHQLVKFNKIPFHHSLMPRFQALAELYQRGAVLADNLFILQQTANLYFYVIEAYIPKQQQQNQAFRHFNKTLHTSPSRAFTPSQTPLQISHISLGSRFTTLSHLISADAYAEETLESKMKMIDRIKILVQCVHQTGQAYMGLSPENIIIDLEDGESIYLAPFQLKVEIGAYGRSRRSYLAPELLVIEQKQKNQEIKVGAEKMMKAADIWALGCIILQVLFYSSPVFYAVNTTNQLKDLHSFLNADKKAAHSLKNCIAKLMEGDHNFLETSSADKQLHGISKMQMLANLLLNCLELDPTKRILTSQRNEPTNLRPNPYNQVQRLAQQSSFVDAALSQKLAEREDDPDTELTLYFVHLSNVEIKREMRINIFLDRKYCIFVSDTDCANKDCNKRLYKIQKSVKMRGKFEKFYQLLSEPIRVELVEDTKIGQILVNLSTLVLESEGRRIWKAPIIGSYCNRNGAHFQEAVIKIKSEIGSKVEQVPFGGKKLMKQIQERKEKIKELKKDAKVNKTITKVTKQSKENSEDILPKTVEANKIAHPLQPVNYFDNINKSLEQICQKWQSKQVRQKAMKEERIALSEDRQECIKENEREVQIPISLWGSETAEVVGNENENGSDRIDRKIKQMLAKLRI